MASTNVDTALIPELVEVAINKEIAQMPVMGGTPCHVMLPGAPDMINNADNISVPVPDRIRTLTELATADTDNADRTYGVSLYDAAVWRTGDAFTFRTADIEAIVKRYGFDPSTSVGTDVRFALAEKIGKKVLALIPGMAANGNALITTGQNVKTLDYRELEMARSKFGRERFIKGPSGKPIEDLPCLCGPSEAIALLEVLEDSNGNLLNLVKYDADMQRKYKGFSLIMEADELQDDDYWYVVFCRSGMAYTYTRDIRTSVVPAQKKIAQIVNVEAVGASVIPDVLPGGELPPLSFYRVPKA